MVEVGLDVSNGKWLLKEGLNPKLSTCGGKYRKEMKALAALQSLLLLTTYVLCTTTLAACV